MKNLETYDFEMFSKAGNNACRSLVKKAIKKITGTKRITEDTFTEYIRDLVSKVADKHAEIEDTEPTYHIAELINNSLSEAGYSFSISRYNL